MDWGQEAQRRLDEIATCSCPGPGVTRLPYTPEHADAVKQISDWMCRAGLEPRLDATATLVGRSASSSNGAAVLIGSHQDSVVEGGRYDGIMGVLIGCLALERLAAEGTVLPFPVEVLAFADEEGVRFPTALIGPRAIAGSFDPEVLEMCDADGLRLRDALEDFGGRPDDIAAEARGKDAARAYLELHIEQGPVLEQSDAAVGIVTGICGIERNSVSFGGETGHAGTVPMEGRRDALVAASEFIVKVHDAARRIDGLRATIGTLALKPDVVNAIARDATLTLEIRALSDAARLEFAAAAQVWGTEIAGTRDVSFAMSKTYEQTAVPCAPDLIQTLEQAAEDAGQNAPLLPSGATHDASAMADLCDISMLFVRCKDGLSHRPEEFASAEDMGAAIDVTCAYLRRLAKG
ncbi:Zn-dependent hydrolase [Rhodobacteraceae bacterium R_SAG3]|nr:Zn-dependent hydrolase [Rhodobacteraceae bacterium R_SAG3]